jgi:hypothetical protein
LTYQYTEFIHTPTHHLALPYLNVTLYTMHVHFVILNNLYSLFEYK